MKCLYNTCSDNVAAYCQNSKHPYAMTVAQMRCKNCLGKQCEHLKRNENHQFWKQKQAQKQKRKDRKERLDNYVDSIKNKV